MLWGDFNGYKIGLVQLVSDMDAIRADLHGSILCGIDTETTGLSYLRCHVVGVCLSTGRSYGKADYRGYYLPIRHLGYSKNLPIEAVISLTQHIVDNYKTAWWNRSFDFSMLEKDGFRCPFVGKTHDIQFMAHEMFNEEMPKLKDFSKRLLGFQTILFGDTGASEGDFGNTDPEVTFLYAGADAVQTALLGIKIWNEYPQVHQIYSLDNMSGEAVRLLTKTPLHLDYGFLKSEVSRCTMSLVELEQEIYGMVGYMFNVRSDREVADALSRFVTLTAKTASGAWKVDKTILGGLDHPLAKLLLQHSELSTYLNSFVKKMSTWEKRSQPVRLNYNLVVALTGRLSSSASTGNDYYAPMNAQNIPKVEEKLYLHEHPTLGYCLCSEEEGCVRASDGSPVKYKTKGGLRNAFIANDSATSDDWVFLGCDYSAEEIALAANWSQEEGLLYPLKHGLDVHLHVAEKMFGVPDPAFRSKSKAVSFGKLYGGGPSLIATRLKITLEAAKALIAHYDITLPRLKRWQEALVKGARRCGFAKTLFGRHIYVGKWFNSGDRAKVAYAERVSLNSPVQGSFPSGVYVESQDGATYRPWRDSVGRRMWFRDRRTSTSRQGVPTFRGTDPLWFVAFNTGDFCVCNDIHKFVRYGDESRLVDLNHICDEITPLVPCGVKGVWSWLRGVGRGCSLARLAITAHMGRSISVGDGVITWSLLKAWLGRKRYITDDPHRAFLLRSVCDLFGWNLVYDFRRSRKLGKYVFRLRWGRRKKAVGVIVRPLEASTPVISPAMCSGLSVYPLGGFVSKNTGGDLIRRDLIKLMQCIARDPECKENLEFQFTIHDEIQVRVRRSYLQKGVKLLQAIMNFWPKEFQTPIMVEPCVGFRLGGELDIDAVSSDGFIIPKGFTPPQSYLDAHPDWYYLDTWFKTMKARRGITEW